MHTVKHLDCSSGPMGGHMLIFFWKLAWSSHTMKWSQQHLGDCFRTPPQESVFWGRWRKKKHGKRNNWCHLYLTKCLSSPSQAQRHCHNPVLFSIRRPTWAAPLWARGLPKECRLFGMIPHKWICSGRAGQLTMEPQGSPLMSSPALSLNAASNAC